METFFSDFDIPKFSENQAKLCEENLTKKDLYNSFKNIQSDKSPFYETFCNELKKIFGDSVSETEEKGN